MPSMKVPPKRKGNVRDWRDQVAEVQSLNESPSEKEGKLSSPHIGNIYIALNESPSEKEGK